MLGWKHLCTNYHDTLAVTVNSQGGIEDSFNPLTILVEQSPDFTDYLPRLMNALFVSTLGITGMDKHSPSFFLGDSLS